MVGLLAEILGHSFERHLPTFLPLLSDCLHLQYHYPDNDGEGLVSMATDKDVSMETNGSSERVNAEGGEQNGGDVENDEEESSALESETENEGRVPSERSLDHFLFGVVHVLCKVLSVSNALRSPVHRSSINTILG